MGRRIRNITAAWTRWQGEQAHQKNEEGSEEKPAGHCSHFRPHGEPSNPSVEGQETADIEHPQKALQVRDVGEEALQAGEVRIPFFQISPEHREFA